MGKCLDLRGLPPLVNDQLINIVSVLQLVYTHLPQGRDRKQCLQGGWKGGDSKQREVGREKNRKDQRVPAEERMRKHATPSLGSSNFFFVAGAATRLIQRVESEIVSR